MILYYLNKRLVQIKRWNNFTRTYFHWPIASLLLLLTSCTCIFEISIPVKKKKSTFNIEAYIVLKSLVKMKTFIFQVYNGDFTQEVIMKKKLITHANYYINKRFLFYKLYWHSEIIYVSFHANNETCIKKCTCFGVRTH